jgi:hypothetical protein
MLTGEMVRVKVVKKTVVPSFIATDNARHLNRAETLVSLMQRALDESWTRGTIESKVRDICGMDVDHKITKGMAKLLLDKGDFETRSPIDPAELRWAVFSEAAKMGPIGRTSGTIGQHTAADVLDVIATKLSCSSDDVALGMYADLKDHQVLATAKIPKPDALLHRYNTALVQAVLIKATQIRITFTDIDPKYVRQIMRYLKFYQLMYRIERNGLQLEVEIDGPQSLLKLSTRYGMQLANFFPAVLLQPGHWTLDADVLWGKKRKFKKTLSLDSTAGLKSHYRDTGTWTSRTETWFKERFDKMDSDWSMGPGQPIDLGGQNLLVPDLTFQKGNRVGHLEIVGFWRSRHLSDRLKALPDNVILAVSSKLKGEAVSMSKAMESRVIRFAEVIPPAKVIERLEKCAT